MTAAGQLAIALMREETMHTNERHRKTPDELATGNSDAGGSSTAWKKQRTLPETMDRKPSEADKHVDIVEEDDDESKSSLSDGRGDDEDAVACNYYGCGEETEKCECGQGGRQHCSVHATACKDRICANCAEGTVRCTQCGAETHENDPDGISTSTVAIKVPGELLEKFPGFPETFTVILCEDCVPFGSEDS
jgi:hypothetical protein